ncbi:hypothetical protein NERG_00257 [Nematocida ausubeli]|uniref:Uncharacterized protein n=1 Tax=Nematocida ausubeli (strain ATCC PRA-371 / ERTm2) TaxID=1913371 RepID=H8Z9I6_NEMA1|nr:hypothetical protein NERG_00257 [Nematocida ausubeli]
MHNLGTFLLLTIGALTVLFLSVAYFECMVESSKHDLFTFFLLSKICTFLLFVKGVLVKRTLHLKYAIYIILHSILSGIYMHHINKIPITFLSEVIALDGVYLLCMLLGIYNSHAQRQLKNRLLSGELEILHYNIIVTNGIMVFITQFAAFIYLMSENTLFSKSAVVIFLVHTQCKRNKYLVYTAGLIAACAFKDVLLAQSISAISLFISSGALFSALFIGDYLEWNIRKISLKRITIE